MATYNSYNFKPKSSLYLILEKVAPFLIIAASFLWLWK